jgi:beta-fructofuranosidase
MALGSQIRGRGGCVLLYRSSDLRRWSYLGPLFQGTTEMMECPNFFPLGDRWLLCVSPYAQVIYAMGDWRDGRFEPESAWLPMDLGGREDFYAPNSMLDPRGRRILWGWVQVGPSGACWKGALTLPRVLSLRGDRHLGIEPIPELARLRARHQRWEGVLLAKDLTVALPPGFSDTLEICAELELRGAREVGLILGSSGGRGQRTIAYDHEAGRLHAAGRSGSFRLHPGEEQLQLRVFLDRSILEIYANGRAALTAGLEHPGVGGGGAPLREDDGRLALFSRGGTAHASALDVWEMTSIWETGSA